MWWFQVLVVLVTVAWLVAARAYLREVNRGTKHVCPLPKLGWKNLVWPQGQEEVVVVQPQIIESGVIYSRH
jgi:hypothetical protein